jgi:DNA polymerase III gamma/tau subunit
MRVESYETFGVDEGRELKEAQLSKSFGGGKKIFVISFETITVEAQNSLLKVFEEPTPDTHFFLISRTGSRLLPTLRSRIVFLQTESDSTPSLLQAKKIYFFLYFRALETH